jgi:hypothetical protein
VVGVPVVVYRATRAHQLGRKGGAALELIKDGGRTTSLASRWVSVHFLPQMHTFVPCFGVVWTELNCIDVSKSYLFMCRNDIETSFNLEIRIISPTLIVFSPL